MAKKGRYANEVVRVTKKKINELNGLMIWKKKIKNVVQKSTRSRKLGRSQIKKWKVTRY